MGCTGSKDQQKAAYDRLSQYQLASLEEESKGFKNFPIPLDEDDENDRNSLHSISTRQFHNLFYDGFYSPYMSNPDYLLLVDTRDKSFFLERHILAARWHGNLLFENDFSKFTLVILYDQDGSGVLNQNSIINQLINMMKLKQLDPIFIRGGISQVESSLPYMIATKVLAVPERQLALSWYPSIIIEQTLWLGRLEQGTNTNILLNLNLTHLVHIGQTRPAVAFPGMTCLTVNWNESLKGQELYNAVKGGAQFVSKAVRENGRILILGDQGVNRSATFTIAFMMMDKNCTLEDGFYHLKQLRPAVQPSPSHLDILSKLEAELFGKKLTSIDDLW